MQPRGFPGTLQGIILLDASRMNLNGSWQVAGSEPGIASKGLQVGQDQALDR